MHAKAIGAENGPCAWQCAGTRFPGSNAGPLAHTDLEFPGMDPGVWPVGHWWPKPAQAQLSMFQGVAKPEACTAGAQAMWNGLSMIPTLNPRD